jgi:hypothetical protein
MLLTIVYILTTGVFLSYIYLPEDERTKTHCILKLFGPLQCFTMFSYIIIDFETTMCIGVMDLKLRMIVFTLLHHTNVQMLSLNVYFSHEHGMRQIQVIKKNPKPTEYESCHRRN